MKPSPTLAETGEQALLKRIRRILGPSPAGVIGPGDDTAVLPPGSGSLLATTDIQVEGTHFRTGWSRPEETGFKSLTVNLSDIAAMGGRPEYALVSLVLPPDLPVTAVERLYRGMQKAARPESVTIVGGNLARGDRISVTVVLLGALPHGEPVLRTGARPGDRIFVTGQPGLAHLGLELLGRRPGEPEDLWRPPASRPPAWRSELTRSHPGSRAALKRFLAPEARLQAARDLALYRPTAMIDVSDGLATDLHRLTGSGHRFVIDTDSIPRSRGFLRLAEALEADPISVSLGGGEDYELLLCLPPSAALRIGRRVVVGGIPLTRIGEVEPGEGVVCRDERGREAPLVPSGFRHFAPE